MGLKNYTLFKCKVCGTEFSIPSQYIHESTYEVRCPMHGEHNDTVVIGAYDNLNECMEHDSYKVVGGVVKRR